MTNSMADYLKVITPYLPTEIVTSQALFNLQNLTKNLPPFYHAGFECKLGSNSSTSVDFTVFLSCRLINNLPNILLEHKLWNSLQDFTEKWVKPTSDLYHGIKILGLEFDVDDKSNKIPIPNIFFEFNSEYKDVYKLIDIIFQHFKQTVSYQLLTNLQNCVKYLPENARIAHFGIMLPRATEAVRIVVEGLQSEQILEYLLKIEVPTNELATVIQELSEVVDNIGFLSFDVGNTLHDRIGLECFSAQQDESDWEKIFNHLINKDLCSQSKQKAMMKWPGWSQKNTAPDLWPDHLNWGDNFLGSKAVSIFFRQINHIKIVYQPNIPLEAKGYLSFEHRWVELDEQK